ncbi:hypothetical protein P4N68_01655 [Corynebacterium felinum]|uniref:Uncharacterized protein n=1 Tax=Corynebacterium felinum TaxID=131318 RepID=A0ABU2B8K3_9CORY|nr:hypothetical protein [Corynebacterium felinum]MDF5819785.1 hypothetical protein [Corynebacterium felinum]MDR7354344.1 hypothetical protein [Corynebacterium felinum]
MSYPSFPPSPYRRPVIKTVCAIITAALGIFLIIGGIMILDPFGIFIGTSWSLPGVWFLYQEKLTQQGRPQPRRWWLITLLSIGFFIASTFFIDDTSLPTTSFRGCEGNCFETQP